MGTRYSAVFHAVAGFEPSVLAASLLAAVDQVDRQMSTWKPDSDLSRVNAAALHEWLEIPGELATVLATALRIGQASRGAFDIGVGALVNAWGFGPTQQQADARQLAALRELPAQANETALQVDLARHRVRKRAALTLDLSGIAKGFAVDQMARCLDSFGIPRYLVGIDGEMRARGLKPDGRRWAIAVEKPIRGRREVMGVMDLTDAAIATSGDYRRYLQLGDKIYAHTINPALRAPVQNRLAAVTVVAASCMLADAWATALLVLGEDDGVELAQQRGMDAVFVLRDGEQFRQISIAAGQLDSC